MIYHVDGRAGGVDSSKSSASSTARTGRSCSASSSSPREAVDHQQPGPGIPRRQPFLEGSPRYPQDDTTTRRRFIAGSVGIDDNGASVDDAKDVADFAHMFGCWETLYVIKKAMEDRRLQGCRQTAPSWSKATERHRRNSRKDQSIRRGR